MQGEWAGEVVGPDVWETCRELIPAGSVFALLAEHREVLFPPGMFAYMYPPANGRPSLPPHVLSGCETVQELRWNAACGLGLYDTALIRRCRRTSGAACVTRPIRCGSSPR
ncbi:MULTISPECIES: hypothetical protein [Streptomyces]|uniref:Uncharacterized protein n=1 Tax=Streptomyces galilaeus TaxID=33899 RepID=A0ABW9IU69_STRGJ|nr:hypothetical protein [Streptomyces galilaeus]